MWTFIIDMLIFLPVLKLGCSRYLSIEFKSNTRIVWTAILILCFTDEFLRISAIYLLHKNMGFDTVDNGGDFSTFQVFESWTVDVLRTPIVGGVTVYLIAKFVFEEVYNLLYRKSPY